MSTLLTDVPSGTGGGPANPIPQEVREKINEYADKYAFRVPYDGTNNFYDEEALKHFLAGAEFGYSLALPELSAKDNRIKELEEAVEFAEWIAREGWDNAHTYQRDEWIDSDGDVFTTQQLYQIFKSANESDGSEAKIPKTTTVEKLKQDVEAAENSLTRILTMLQEEHPDYDFSVEWREVKTDCGKLTTVSIITLLRK